MSLLQVELAIEAGTEDGNNWVFKTGLLLLSMTLIFRFIYIFIVNL